MGSRIVDNEWGYSKGNKVFKIHRDFLEQPMRDSRCTYNESTGIGELYLNCRTNFPVNQKKTELRLSKVLKKEFNAFRYICVVQSGNKVRNEDVFFTNVDFHFKTKELPANILKIVSIVEEELKPRIFLRIDKETGESEEVTFFDLPKNSKYYIIKMCENPELSRGERKRRSFDGAYWEYA